VNVQDISAIVGRLVNNTREVSRNGIDDFCYLPIVEGGYWSATNNGLKIEMTKSCP
jgi:hypothetical protein